MCTLHGSTAKRQHMCILQYFCCRHTYEIENKQKRNRIVIPSRSASLAASFLRLQERRQLRERKKSPKKKLFLCSMCKTHCFDSDSSGTEQTVNLTTPPIRISFKSPEGPSVMEIEPRQYKKPIRKRKHSSKQRSRKHAKKSELVDNNEHDGEEVAEETPLAVALDTTNCVNGATARNTSEEDSTNDALIIDLPGEHSVKGKKKKPQPVKNQSTTTSSNNANITEHSPSNSDQPQPTQTKTKARLRKQKYAPKVNRNSKPNASNSADDPGVSVVSERTSRFVSTYESADGKHISVGDIIWGKIVGFPWWPGRVCTITVSENQEGITMGHIADIDWYCSPTKSHLSCADIYPFLEEFSKR